MEKAIVGQVKYATPIFSAEMRSIVFHPDWTVPETIKLEDLQPRLRQTRGGVPDVSVLRDNKLSVSYQGRPVDAETVDWERANILSYTFTQAPGPDNVLGTLKFNFPNRHAIYMHDTVQPELFNETVRTLSHGCIRVHQPDRLAALLLAEDKGWSEQQVKDLLAKGQQQRGLAQPAGAGASHLFHRRLRRRGQDCGPMTMSMGSTKRWLRRCSASPNCSRRMLLLAETTEAKRAGTAAWAAPTSSRACSATRLENGAISPRP